MSVGRNAKPLGMTALARSDTARRAETAGLLAAIASFLLWGLVAPVYFKLISHIGPVEIVSHRIVWTVVLVGALVLATRPAADVLAAVGSWRRLGIFALTTVLVTTNWTVFIYAVVTNQLVQSSLGYYINPLVNVLLGVVFLQERLSKRQTLAVAIAALGVSSLVVSHGTVPWIALTLAVTFGFYALVRKKAGIDPIVGLLVETALLAPFAVGHLVWLGADGAFGTAGLAQDLLLALAGPMTAVPLVLFMYGAQRLKLSTVGLLQYIGPTGMLVLGVLAFGEAFTPAHGVAFACIWTALALYSADTLATRRAAARAAAAE